MLSVAAQTTNNLYTINPSSLQPGTVGSSYTGTLSPSINLYPPYRWSVQSGSLPPGVNIDTVTGRLNGFPTTAGTSTFIILLTDGQGHIATQAYTLGIQSPQFTIHTANELPLAYLGVSYVHDLNQGNASNTYSWSLRSGSLPSELTLGSNGMLYGTAHSAGTWMFTARVTDGPTIIAEKQLTLRVGYIGSSTPSSPPVTVPSSWPATSTGTVTPPSTNYTPPSSYTPNAGMDQASLLANLARLNISTNSLVRVTYDPSGVNDSMVYYIGSDGKRHAFPHTNIYNSWYPTMSGIRTIQSWELASIPLGKSIFYRPGTSILKFDTIPHLYVTEADGSLRRLSGEIAASTLYGIYWNNRLATISDALFTNFTYRGGADITNTSEYNPQQAQDLRQHPGQMISTQ